MVAAAGKLYTVNEFLALPEEMTEGCELLNGRIVKKHYWRDTENGMTPRSLNHALTITYTASKLRDFVHERNLGIVLTTPSFLVGADRSQSRKPDVAFVAGSIPTEPEAILALVPTLAVEIMSPNNTVQEMEDKVAEYLAAGTQLVWLTFPESRTVIAFWEDRGAVFRPGDAVTAEPVLPGFSRPVTDLFPPQRG
jgi:Uma2 family endonuclease